MGILSLYEILILCLPNKMKDMKLISAYNIVKWGGEGHY